MIEGADEQNSELLNVVQLFFDCYEEIETVIRNKKDPSELIQIIDTVSIVMFALQPFVGVAVIVGHTGLDAVHMMVIACAVNHQVLVSSESATMIDGIKAAVVIVEDDVTGLAVVVVSIRAEIQVSIGGSAFCAFLSRPCECSCGKHRNDHEDGQKHGEQPRALGFEKYIHLVIHPFILVKKKPSAL